MTEDQARQKWCPFARASQMISRDGQALLGTGQGYNRAYTSIDKDVEIYKSPAECRCIASDCMAWVDFGEGNGDCGLKSTAVLDVPLRR